MDWQSKRVFVCECPIGRCCCKIKKRKAATTEGGLSSKTRTEKAKTIQKEKACLIAFCLNYLNYLMLRLQRQAPPAIKMMLLRKAVFTAQEHQGY